MPGLLDLLDLQAPALPVQGGGAFWVNTSRVAFYFFYHQHELTRRDPDYSMTSVWSPALILRGRLWMQLF